MDQETRRQVDVVPDLRSHSATGQEEQTVQGSGAPPSVRTSLPATRIVEKKQVIPGFISLRCEGHKHRFRACIIEASLIDPMREAISDGVWYLNRLLVAYEARGNGIGTELIRRLAERLKTLGATKLIVEPGGYGSDPKRLWKFYSERGFAPDGADGEYLSMRFV